MVKATEVLDEIAKCGVKLDVRKLKIRDGRVILIFIFIFLRKETEVLD